MGIIKEQFDIVGNYKTELQTISNLSNTATNSLRTLGGVVGIGFSIGAFVQMSDSISQLNQRIKLASVGTEEFSSVQYKLREEARLTRASYETLATTFAKLGMQTKGLFESNDEIVKFTGNLQKLFTVSGLDTTGIQSVLFNLTQSLSTGALVGQDYRILKMNAPQFVQVLKDYYGVAQKELDDMVSAGKVSAEDIKKAFLDENGGIKEISDAFKEMPVTFSQAMTMLGDAVKQQLEPVLLSGAKIARFMADNIGLIVDALKVAVVSIAVFNARLLITKALASSGIFSNLIGALSAIPAMMMGSAAATSAFTFSLAGLKTALISTGIGAIPVIIGVAIVAIGKLIDAFGGIKAVLLSVQNSAIVIFESIAGVFGSMIEGIVNTYRQVKSFFTGERYEEYKIGWGVNEDAKKKREAEIEAERERYRGKNASTDFNNITIDGFSSNAQNQMTNSVKLADEDIKYITDLAERKYVMQVNLSTMPNVSINQNVNGDGASNVFDIEKGLSKVLDRWDGVSNVV